MAGVGASREMLQDRYTDLARQVNELETKYQKTIRDNGVLETQVYELNKQCGELALKVVTLKDDKLVLNKIINDKESELTLCNRFDASSSRAQILTLTQENSNLKADRGILRSQIQILEAENKRLNEEREHRINRSYEIWFHDGELSIIDNGKLFTYTKNQ